MMDIQFIDTIQDVASEFGDHLIDHTLEVLYLMAANYVVHSVAHRVHRWRDKSRYDHHAHDDVHTT